MNKNFKRTYRFAIITAAYITGFLTFLMGVFLYYIGELHIPFIIGIALMSYILSFVIIQRRVERFIYKGIKNIYDDVSLLDATSFSSQPITTDMKTLTEQVGRFAENKKLEIESLKIRENYRKDFLGNISHELKTPLFTVQGYILTLLDGAIKDKAVRKKYLKRANKGVERLIYIVKDLDMITKLESGGLLLNKEVFNIVKLIKTIFEQLEMKAAKKNIKLVFDMKYPKPIHVKADKERMQQVLSNLIENSIKYGVQDGITEVSVENLIQNKVIVRITDNGDGIEKQNIKRIFERFFRVDKSGSRKVGGSGLGLSIVKHIVEVHGEKIYVESQLGVGSEFSFTLEKVQKNAQVSN